MVTGIDKLKRRLEKHGVTMRKAVGAAMEAGGQRVASQALFLVPKESGELASTIRSTDIRTTKRGNLAVYVLAGDERTRVGSNKQFQLARILEFGSTQRPAVPFLMPAWRMNRKAIRAGIRKAMRDAIRAANT